LTFLRVMLIFLFCLESVFADSRPSFLSDPEIVDPDYPPVMTGGGVDSNGHALHAIVYLANGKGPHPTVILLHGFPGNEKNLDLAQAIRRVGWNVVFFHYRGSWGSEGEYSIPNANEDVAAMIRFVRESGEAGALRIDPQNIVLIGHSFGGFYALFGAANNKGIACVAGIAAVDIGGAAKRSLAEDVPLWPWLRERSILKGFKRDAAIKDIYTNKDKYELGLMADDLAGSPTLMVTPDGDGEWAVNNQTAVAGAYKEAGANVSFFLVKDADHAFSGKRIKLMEIVTNWLNHSCLP
jgi:pimeloyl-ACP methyl ester carboxylesterase